MECPLKDHDLKNINRAIFSLNDMLPEIDKAERIGLDMEEMKIRRDDLMAKMMALKEVYFPGR